MFNNKIRETEFFNWYKKFMAIAVVIVFFTAFDVYNFNFGAYPIQPKIFLLLFGIGTLPIIYRNFRKGNLVLKDKLFIIAFSILLLFFLRLVLEFNDSELSIFETQLTGILFLLLCYGLFHDKKAKEVSRKTIFVCLIFAVFINLFEIYYPGSFSINPGRSAGIYVNSNIAAYALNTGMILTFSFVAPRFRLIFLFLVGSAILSTMSRSGLLIFCVIALLLLLRKEVPISLKKTDVMMNAFVMVLLSLYFYSAYLFVPDFNWVVNKKMQNSVRFSEGIAASPKNYVQINPTSDPTSNPTSSSQSGASNDGVEAKTQENVPGSLTEGIQTIKVIEKTNSEMARTKLIGLSLSVFKSNPFLGVGMAKAWQLSPHNIYLLHGVAYGLVGWVVVPGLILMIFLIGDRKIGLYMAIVYLLAGLFSHNLMVDRTILLPLAMVAASDKPKDTTATNLSV